MRQLLPLITAFSLILLSCGQQTNESIKSGGIWHLDSGVFNSDGSSKKAVIGSDSDVEIAMEFFNAYADLNPQRMVELSEDIVKFHPGDVAGVFDVDSSNTDFLVQRQSNFESMDRTIINITPLAVEGSENYTVVEINFTETIAYKDGTTSSAHFFERIHVENKKVNRVVQWIRPM